MTETPADLTTDEERDSSSEKAMTAVCDNDTHFNDVESSDKEV